MATELLAKATFFAVFAIGVVWAASLLAEANPQITQLSSFIK